MILTAHEIFFGLSGEGEWGGCGIWHVWRRREMYTGFLWGNMK